MDSISLFKKFINIFFCLVQHGDQQVPEVPKTMMYHMTKKNIDQHLDVLHLDLIGDVHHGVHKIFFLQ